MTIGAWTAKVQDSSQWLAVDLGREYVITKLQTQGRQGSGEYVSEYMFAFSNDAITWRYYTNEFGIREVLHSFALVLDKTYLTIFHSLSQLDSDFSIFISIIFVYFVKHVKFWGYVNSWIVRCLANTNGCHAFYFIEHLIQQWNP